MIRLSRRRTHHELDRAVDHSEGLPLVIHEPEALVRSLDLHQLSIEFLQFFLFLPLSQGPFGAP